MASSDEIRQSATLAEVAIKAMVTRGIPPTPHNYAVWYVYATKLRVELNREIDAIISEKREFTAKVNEDLYNRFFDSREQLKALNEAGGQFQTMVDKVLQTVATVGGETRAFGNKLDDYSVRLDGEGGSQNAKTIVADLAEETRAVSERNRVLEAQLNQSSQEIAELKQRLVVVRQEAFTDALTGIPNRHSFDENLKDLTAEAVVSGDPLCLLILDIDHFKHFNDSFGHLVGDQVLRLVGHTLTDCVKGRDMPARYGGEEFVILVPQTKLSDAVTVADQIRTTLMRRKIVRRDSGKDYGTITVSVGVSLYRSGEPLDALIKRADEALYRAKREGRNRVLAETAGEPVLQA